jgi:hypothetical protein
MTDHDLVAAVSDDTKTELSRLGSSKSLFADTGGELEPDVVLSAMADAAHHAAERLDGWDDDAVGDIAADAAARVRDQYDAIVGELDEHDPGEAPAVVEALPADGDAAERLGALVGWTMVAERKASQATGFFTGQADPSTASLFREFGDDYETIRTAALEALDEEADAGDAARDAAIATVEAAYDEYVERLEAQGVNPKPVC